MSFCYSPWTNVDLSPTGYASPCCKFQGPTPVYSTLDEYASSKFLEDIKQDFKNGDWPDGCIRCKTEEQNNIESKRQLDYQRWEHHYESYDLECNQFITASIAFGNTCNLKCITCSPTSSSKWHKEHNQIYGTDVQPVKFFKQNFVSEFIKHAPAIMHLDIPGGEPFLSGIREQKELLTHYVESGQASNMTIHYTTNATILPGQEWWDLWSYFKEVEIQLSIDGIGSRYEYIRFPGNWEQVSTNIAEYIRRQSQVRLSVSHTVSAYNIYYLDEFFSWCYNQKLPKPWLGKVNTPAHMRPTVWSNDAKQFIIGHLQSSTNQDVQNWANLLINTDDSNMFNTFKQRCQEHDQYRKLDFKNVFPELAPYI